MVFAWRLSAIRRRHAAALSNVFATSCARESMATRQRTFATVTARRKPSPSDRVDLPFATDSSRQAHIEPSSSSSQRQVVRDDESHAYISQLPHTKLPTPLPKHLQKSLSGGHGSTKSLDYRKRSSHAEPSSQLSFGDLSGATLQAIRKDSTFFPSSQSAENVAILQACLSTNLLMRALKIFAALREDNNNRLPASDAVAASGDGEVPKATRQRWASLSMLHRTVYNSVLAALFRRAVSETRAADCQQWMDRAWSLYKEMEKGKKPSLDGRGYRHTLDPVPDESTVAAMAKGLIACVRSHDQITTEHTGLSDLVISAWRANMSFDKILRESESNVGTAEDKGALAATDPAAVAHSMMAAAIHCGHMPAKRAVDAAAARLQAQASTDDAPQEAMPDPAADIPELRPVASASYRNTTKLPEADPEDTRPMNLTLLHNELAVVRQARQTIRDDDQRQRLLEETSLESARQRLEASAKHLESIGLRQGEAMSSDSRLQLWMWDWTQKLQTAIEADIARIAAEAKQRENERVRSPRSKREEFEKELHPLLELLPAPMLAILTVLETLRLQGSGGVMGGMKTARALIAVGSAVEQEFYAKTLRDNPHLLDSRRQASDQVKKSGIRDLSARKKAREWLKENSSEMVANTGLSDGWTPTLRARVGGFLISHLLQVATVEKRARDRDGEEYSEQHPAFYATYQYIQGKKLGIIKLNETVADRLDRDPLTQTLQPRHLPMLTPPCSWLKYDEGGYLVAKSELMRFKDSAEQLSYLKAASEAGNLEVVMSGLDVLGDTPWNINKDVFRVVTQVWNEGSGIGAIPDLRAPDAWRRGLTRPPDYDTNIAARARYLQEEKEARLDHAANHSLRCSVNYQLEIARAFIGEKFYFPHNIDFRGRAYPIPAHLNHMGNDLCRGLLKFADGKPLGKSGLRWLRIHLANVYGYDKASFDEREQFALDHIADIEDAVNHPLDGQRWWLEAEDPWQCLATCHELVGAMKCPEGPEHFVSHIPVHQDGTCNGLQHYAALGGDLAGAKQVNLAGGDRPSDVYTAVADLVIAKIEEDYVKRYATEGETSLPAMLRGKITRKVVKQSVMTTVYGVTMIGAKAQVEKQLSSRGDIPVEHVWPCATYVAKLILSSVGNLFGGAEKIQVWLTESARLIARSIPPERAEWLKTMDDAERRKKAKSELERLPFSTASRSRLLQEQMTSVIWSTPLALPVVQPYRRMNKRQIETALQTIFLKDPKENSEVSPSKQASAFPPNFIHSLDATHMILTALECQQAGLTFAAVHDSYWTHACDVETMSELIRDCFVRLHSADILPQLRAEFIERYAGYKVPVVVANNYLQKRKGLFAEEDAEVQAKVDDVLAKGAEEDLASSHEEAEDEEDVVEEEEEAAASPKKSSRKRSDVPANHVIMEAEAAAKLLGKSEEDSEPSEPKRGRPFGATTNKTRFVNLTDLLPPLPQKGTFDVNEIKSSMYFFS